MFSTADTIVAIATPPGRGSLGVVRLSGPDALRMGMELAGREHAFEARYATLVRISSPDGVIDHALVTAFHAPHSYTGEDVVEVSAHGSPVLLRSILNEALRVGARLANPGEFTLRAFLNGRIDLVQAEAVSDLIDAVTPLQARAAFDQLEGTLTHEIGGMDAALFDLTARLEASLDFPGEGYHFVSGDAAVAEIREISARVDRLLHDSGRGRLIRDGLHVVLTGRPNSGKSSLFNRLAGAGRAIVTEIPGTTRDLITETTEIAGVPVTLVDTAGIHPMPADAVEAEGIARAHAARTVASLVIVVLDGSLPLADEDRTLLRETAHLPSLVVANKADLDSCWADDETGRPLVRVSALTGDGIEALRCAIVVGIEGDGRERDVPAVTNMRHVDLLRRARASLEAAATAAAAQAPEEFVLADLQEARRQLEEITGQRTPDDVLNRIFARFCIGK